MRGRGATITPNVAIGERPGKDPRVRRSHARIVILGPGDEDLVDAFLRLHPDSSMFLRANLRRGGLADGEQRFQGLWAGAVQGGALLGVATSFWNGLVQVQAPGHAAPLVRAVALASPRPVRGLLGPWGQVVAARSALGLQAAACRLDSREVLFALDLEGLVLPPTAWAVRRSVAADIELLTRWDTDADVEAIGLERSRELVAENREATERFVRDGEQFVLEQGGEPVSTCTFNAALPDCVQIGGVWTPPEWRSRGHARAVVAGALAIARGEGVSRSILFTGEHNHPALRAYAAIGFTPVGDFGLVLFEAAHRVAASRG